MNKPRIIIDSYEPRSKIEHITSVFDRYKVEYSKTRLVVGDYMNPDKPHIVIERKKSLLELAVNLSYKDKERFKRELERAKEVGVHVVILNEDGNSQQLDDLEGLTECTLLAGVKDIVRRSTIARNTIKPEELCKKLRALTKWYDVEIQFCNPADTGIRIIDILFDEDVC